MGEVVARRDAPSRHRPQEPRHRCLHGGEIDRRRGPAVDPEEAVVLRPAKIEPRAPDEVYSVSRPLQVGRHAFSEILDDADPEERGRRQDGPRGALIVQGDVPARDCESERGGGLADPPHCLSE